MAEQKKQEPTQAIQLKIAGKPYKLRLKVSELEKEEIYRMAEREINAILNQYKHTFEGFNDQDCLAMAGLSLCINNIAIARQSEMDSEDMKALDELSQRLDKHLNRLSRQ